MPKSYSKRSNKNIDSCDKDWRTILDAVIQIIIIDLVIYQGHRPQEEQFEEYKKGRAFIDGEWVIINKKEVVTNTDGYTKKGKHNLIPSMAIDFYAYIPGQPKRAYDELHLTYIAATIQTVSRLLYEAGEIKHLVRWGGNWDNDGIIKYDQTLQDLCHCELYIP